MPTEQATRFTCPECGATLQADGDATAATCSYCGTPARLQRRTKLMQLPIKLPPPAPEEPAKVARAHREWSAATIASNIFFAVLPLLILGVLGWTVYTQWHRAHTTQWDDLFVPRLLDCDGDGVDDLVGHATLDYDPEVAAISGKTGRLLWHTAVGTRKNDAHTVTVVGGMVVVVDARGTIYGIDHTGAQRWRSELPDSARDVCREPTGAPAAQAPDAALLIGLPDYSMRRLTVATGALAPFTKPHDFSCVPARGTGLDYMPSGGEVDDHPAIELPTIGIPTVVTRGTGLRVVVGEHEGGGRKIPRLAGVRTDRSVAWEHDVATGDPRDVVTGPPDSFAISDDAVAALYRRRVDRTSVRLAVFDRATGATRFDVETRMGKLAMTSDYVAVGTNRCLTAYDTKTGKVLWSYECR